jgi:hypothetical protein
VEVRPPRPLTASGGSPPTAVWPPFRSAPGTGDGGCITAYGEWGFAPHGRIQRVRVRPSRLHGRSAPCNCLTHDACSSIFNIRRVRVRPSRPWHDAFSRAAAASQAPPLRAVLACLIVVRRSIFGSSASNQHCLTPPVFSFVPPGCARTVLPGDCIRGSLTNRWPSSSSLHADVP